MCQWRAVPNTTSPNPQTRGPKSTPFNFQPTSWRSTKISIEHKWRLRRLWVEFQWRCVLPPPTNWRASCSQVHWHQWPLVVKRRKTIINQETNFQLYSRDAWGSLAWSDRRRCCDGRPSASVVRDAQQRRQWLAYPLLDVVLPIDVVFLCHDHLVTVWKLNIMKTFIKDFVMLTV